MTSDSEGRLAGEPTARAAFPRVCVVIPSRDRPRGLGHALESVLGQGVEGTEVVIVDDASTPPVHFQDERVRVIRNDEPVGPAGARNLGAASTEAELIAFLDDDDYWLPGKLVACLACFDKYPEAGMMFHRTAPHGAQPPETGRARVLDEPVRRMLTQQPPHLDSVVVRRQVHEQVLFDETFHAAEDLDYLIRVADETTVVELDRVLARHGPPSQRVSQIALEARIEGRRKLREKHARLFSDGEVVAFHNVRLGHLYRRHGRRGRSIACFLRAIGARPGSGLGWRGLASVFLLSGRQVANRRSPDREPGVGSTWVA